MQLARYAYAQRHFAQKHYRQGRGDVDARNRQSAGKWTGTAICRGSRGYEIWGRAGERSLTGRMAVLWIGAFFQAKKNQH